MTTRESFITLDQTPDYCVLIVSVLIGESDQVVFFLSLKETLNLLLQNKIFTLQINLPTSTSNLKVNSQVTESEVL